MEASDLQKADANLKLVATHSNENHHLIVNYNILSYSRRSAHAPTPVWLLFYSSAFKTFFSRPCAYNRLFSI